MDYKEKQEYIAKVKNFTDRQLLEYQTFYSRKQAEYLRIIMFIVVNAAIISAIALGIVFSKL